MKKALVIGVILLLLSVGVQPAIGNEISTNAVSDDKEQKGNLIVEKNPIHLPIGFIVVITYFWVLGYGTFLLPWVRISCTNLNTGTTRLGRTNIIGLHIFKFLPNGHDYRISVLSGFAPDIIIRDLFFFAGVTFTSY